MSENLNSTTTILDGVATTSDNPNFYPGMSSDEVYFGQDMTVCLTDVVEGKVVLRTVYEW